MPLFRCTAPQSCECYSYRPSYVEFVLKQVSNFHLRMAEPAENREPWPNTRQAYELGEAIGIGATATVYKVLLSVHSGDFNFQAMCIPRNEKCAIKCINLEKCQTSVDELSHEISVINFCLLSKFVLPGHVPM